MPFIDWLILALLIVFCVFGMLFGFGKGLKFFTGGIIGFIISIFVCYALGGLILKLGFVKDLLFKFTDTLAQKGNGFCNFLIKIRIDIIVYYIVLFIIVSILRIIIVRIIKSVFEIENVALIVINKIFGIILFVTVYCMLVLTVFWIISLIGGGTAASFENTVSQSKIGLKWLYVNNPFMEIIKFIKIKIVVRA